MSNRSQDNEEVVTMPAYKAPLRDISFVMNELLESEKLYQTLPGYEDATTDLMILRPEALIARVGTWFIRT